MRGTKFLYYAFSFHRSRRWPHKKTSLEALSFGAALAKQTGVPAEGILLGTVTDDLVSLGNHGIQKIHHVPQGVLNALDAEQYIAIISGLVEKKQGWRSCASHTNTGRAIAPGLSVKLKAGLVTGCTAPDTVNGFIVKNVFSGKAFSGVCQNTC